MEAIIDVPVDVSSYAHRLKAAGVNTVIRYYNNKNSNTFPTKCLTASERDALFAEGLSIAVVFEQRAGAGGVIDDLSAANGTRDGSRALSLALALDQPRGTAIYFAVDWDFTTQSQLTTIGAYFAAVRAALGENYLVGVYGSGLVSNFLLGKGLVEHVWLAGATGWSGTKQALAAGKWSLFQKFLDKTSPIGGFGYDGNVTNPANANFGQFSGIGPLDTPKTVGTAALFEVSARSGLNLRGGPGESYKVIETVPHGTVVTGLARESDWLKVDLKGDGTADGYMFGTYLKALSGGVPLPAPTPTPGAPGGTAPIDIAWQELAIGVKEVPGDENNPRIVMYHATTSGGAAPDETAWCSSFVNYCVERAGLAGTDSKWARSWHESRWGSDVTANPREGDIVVFRRVGAGDDGGHVGFYLEQDDDTTLVLGGNQGNRISKSRYPKNGMSGPYRYTLLSIRRP